MGQITAFEGDFRACVGFFCLFQAFVVPLNSLIENKEEFIQTVIGNIADVLDSQLSGDTIEADRAAYAGIQKQLQVLLTDNLKSR